MYRKETKAREALGLPMTLAMLKPWGPSRVHADSPLGKAPMSMLTHPVERLPCPHCLSPWKGSRVHTDSPCGKTPVSTLSLPVERVLCPCCLSLWKCSRVHAVSHHVKGPVSTLTLPVERHPLGPSPEEVCWKETGEQRTDDEFSRG